MAGVLELRQSSQDSTNARLLNLISNPFESELQLDAFWASLGTSLGFSVLLATFFSFLRPRHNLVYAPKIKHADSRHAPPPIGRGPLAWIKPVWHTKESVLVEKIGMDAVFFLRFIRMLRNMFSVLGIIGICIMIPVNIGLGTKALSDKSNGFSQMTPLYVFGKGLWAQVVVTWAVDIVVAFFLWWNYRKFYQLRRQYFESPDYQRSLHARTILIRDLPANARSDEGILRLTDEVDSTGTIPKAAVGRNVGVLPDLIEEYEDAVRELEAILAKYLKNPNQLPAKRPTMRAPRSYKGHAADGKVDSIEFLTERVRHLEAKILDARERVDMRDAMGYGFASWEQISQAHATAFAAKKKNPQGAKFQLAPKPNDLIWKNLGLTKAARGRKRWMNAVWITVLTIVWTPINAAIAIFLSNLANLGSVWPGFQASLEAHRGWWSLVQGIAAPGLTSLVYLILPIIFRRLQIRAGDVTKTSREKHVLRNLYNFFTFNNLIIFSIFSAVWQYITAVVNNSHSESAWDALRNGQFFLTVTTALCTISPFWILWLLQRNLGAAIDLAQLWPLFYKWFQSKFMAPTPREKIEWSAPQPFDYASYYNYFLFYSTIGFCFATLQPLVLVVAAFYFAMDSVLKKYLLMYVFVTKTESGGQFWRTLFNRLVFGACLGNVVVAVVVKARGKWVMVGAIAPAVVAMIAFKIYCSKKFDAGMHYYHRTNMRDVERLDSAANPKSLVRASGRFRHPALVKPLMTPMVSAKAQYILPQVYSGRLNAEIGNKQDYDDIAMEPMNAGRDQPPEASFEFVPESQQDFMYYRNRSDFHDEGGDIYGRADDLISERSGTPFSRMSHRPQTPSQDLKHEYKSYTPSPPSGIVAPVARRPLGRDSMHSTLRELSDHRAEDNDLSVRHGRYTDPSDDRQILLHDTEHAPTPTGEFMSIDRWRTGSEGGSLNATPTTAEGEGSYGFFRHPRR